MEIERFITKEDFLKLKPFKEGGTLVDGRRYAAMTTHGKLSIQNQLKNLGKVDKTGEGVVDRVFFFELLRDPIKEFWNEDGEVTFQVVSAKIIEYYKYVSKQEAYKEVALVNAKIALRDKELGKGSNGEEIDR